MKTAWKFINSIYFAENTFVLNQTYLSKLPYLIEWDSINVIFDFTKMFLKYFNRIKQVFLIQKN